MTDKAITQARDDLDEDPSDEKIIENPQPSCMGDPVQLETTVKKDLSNTYQRRLSQTPKNSSTYR